MSVYDLGTPEEVPHDMPAFEYGEEYFRSHLGPLSYDRSNSAIIAFFAAVADQIIRSLRPRTVLDAGCAMGFLVEALWDRGVQAYGIDISSYAIGQVRRDIRPYCRVASLTEPIAGRYDVVTCIEVLEHMSEADAMAAMDHLTAVTDVILFSSTSTDLEEASHINVRQPIWWLEQFQRRGFVPDVIFDALFVTPSAMLLRRSHVECDWNVLRLFSEWLRYKAALHARDQLAARLTALNEQSAGQIAALTSERDAALADAARQQSHAASVVEQRDAALAEGARHTAEATAAIQERDKALKELAEYREEETQVRAELTRLAEAVEILHAKQDKLAAHFAGVGEGVRLAADVAGPAAAPASVGQMLTETEAALERLIEHHQILLTTLEEVSRQRDALMGNVTSARAPSAEVAGQPNRASDDRMGDLALQIAGLSRGQQLLQEHVNILTGQVKDILKSRIWQTLVAAGGLVLRLTPRLRR